MCKQYTAAINSSCFFMHHLVQSHSAHGYFLTLAVTFVSGTWFLFLGLLPVAKVDTDPEPVSGPGGAIMGLVGSDVGITDNSTRTDSSWGPLALSVASPDATSAGVSSSWSRTEVPVSDGPFVARWAICGSLGCLHTKTVLSSSLRANVMELRNIWG